MEVYDDIFCEQLVAKEKTASDSIFTVGMSVLGFVLVIITFSIKNSIMSFISPILFVVIVFGLYYLIKSRRIEYEYSVTNGIFDVAKITDKSRRKELYSIECKNVQKVVKLGGGIKSDKAVGPKFDKILDATSGNQTKEVYYMIARVNEKTIKVYFEPNEKVLEACKKGIPRIAWM